MLYHQCRTQFEKDVGLTWFLQYNFFTKLANLWKVFDYSQLIKCLNNIQLKFVWLNLVSFKKIFDAIQTIIQTGFPAYV